VSSSGLAPLIGANFGRMWAAVPSGKACAPSVRTHCETVLRSFYDYHLEAGDRPGGQPVPAGPVTSGRAGGRTRTTTRWSRSAKSGSGSTGRGCRRGFPAASRMRSSTRSSPGCPRTGPGDGRVLRLHGCPGLGVAVGYPGRGGPGAAADHGDPQGQRRAAGAPGLHRRVRLAAALPGRDGGPDPEGRRQSLWWTLRRPARPQVYHAVHRMFERAGQARQAARRAPPPPATSQDRDADWSRLTGCPSTPPPQWHGPVQPGQGDQSPGPGLDQLLRGLLPLRVVLPGMAHQRAPGPVGHAQVQAIPRQVRLWGPDDGRLSRPVLRAAGVRLPPPTHPGTVPSARSVGGAQIWTIWAPDVTGRAWQDDLAWITRGGRVDGAGNFAC
jgi:hypothetical protein